MRILVACEFSGIVRDAFIRRGFDAVSCDLLPTEAPGPHIQGDVLAILDQGWDALIGHPPCTYLTNSGVRWLHERPERWQQMRDGAEFFNRLKNAPIEHVALENPLPHGYAIDLIGEYQQMVQPYHFGDEETKGICLWLKNLPPLMSTAIATKREARVHRMPPGPDRWKDRSRFFPGVADAMADQWGTWLRMKQAA